MIERLHTLVMSGAYCAGDVHAEYGAVPSAFLPIGMIPIFELQTRAFRRGSDRYCITVPDNYTLSRHEAETLRAADVEVFRVDPSHSVPRALHTALMAAGLDGALRLVFGDTLIEDVTETLDSVAVSQSLDCHDWTGAVVDRDGRATFREAVGDDDLRKAIVTGHFVFSSARRLAQSAHGKNSVAEFLNAYAADAPLSLTRPLRWFDVGHMSRLTKSRQDFLVARAFNSIEIDGQIVTKRSRDEFKLKAELNWYKRLPEALRPFAPQIVSDRVHQCPTHSHPFSYRLEYLHLPNLAELAIFGRLPGYRWRQLLECCLDFLRLARTQFEMTSRSRSELDPQTIFEELFRKKTASRIDGFLSARGWSRRQKFYFDGVAQPPLHEIAARLLSLVRPTRDEHLTFAHGDFFFSNILYDSRADSVKALDPRGYIVEGSPSPLGDWRYDLAKLGHSVYGHYDQIVAGRRYYARRDECSFATAYGENDAISKAYEQLEIFGQSVLTREIKAIIGLLFLGMLPLHAEDEERQDQFLANAFRIYRDCASDPC